MDRSEYEDLLFDSSKRTVESAVQVIISDPALFNGLVAFALTGNNPYAGRAARVIQEVARRNPEIVEPHLPRLVNNLDNINNRSLLRGVLKTISDYPRDYTEDWLGILVDVCFRLFNDPGEEIAVRAYALDILFRISLTLPDIRGELRISVEQMMPYASAGLKVRGRRVLNSLKETR